MPKVTVPLRSNLNFWTNIRQSHQWTPISKWCSNLCNLREHRCLSAIRWDLLQAPMDWLQILPREVTPRCLKETKCKIRCSSFIRQDSQMPKLLIHQVMDLALYIQIRIKSNKVLPLPLQQYSYPHRLSTVSKPRSMSSTRWTHHSLSTS